MNLDAFGDFGDLDKLLSDSGILISTDSSPEPGVIEDDLIDLHSDMDTTDISVLPTQLHLGDTSHIATPFDNKVIVPEIKSVKGLDNCVICCNPLYMKVKLPCTHDFCFNCIKGQMIRLSKNQMASCPICNDQISSKFVKKMNKNPNTLANIDISEAYISNQDSYWFYSGRNRGWWSYDIPSTKMLETLYQKHKKGEDISQMNKISICGMTRIIDLDKMLQINEFRGGIRRIRRVTASKIDKFLLLHTVKGMSGYSMNYSQKQ